MKNSLQAKKRRSIEVTVGCEEEATSSEGTEENLEVISTNFFWIFSEK